MKIGAFGILAICVAVGSIDIFTLYIDAHENVRGLLIVIEVILYSLSGIVFGLGVLMSRRKLGDIAMVIGILEIGIGVFLGSFVLAFFALVLVLPATILEIVLIVQLYKKT